MWELMIPYISFFKKDAILMLHHPSTSVRNGMATVPEKFADTTTIGGLRAYYPHVAGDEKGNAFVSFWHKSAKKTGLAKYLWRKNNGEWTAMQQAQTTFHAASPKVQYAHGVYYMLYHQGDMEKFITSAASWNSLPLGEDLRTNTFNFDPETIDVQNQGATFAVSKKGKLIACGNIRKRFKGPVGV